MFACQKQTFPVRELLTAVRDFFMWSGRLEITLDLSWKCNDIDSEYLKTDQCWLVLHMSEVIWYMYNHVGLQQDVNRIES